MNKKMKSPYALVIFGIVLYAVLMNVSLIIGLIKGVWAVIFPVALGFTLAFILNVPMTGIQRLLTKMTARWKKKPPEKLLSVLSLILTIIIVALVVVLVIVMVIPSLVESVTGLYDTVMAKWPEWAAFLSKHNIDTTSLSQWLENLDIQSLFSQVSSGAGSLISSTVGAVSSLVSGVFNFFVAVILACYALLSKKQWCGQVKKLVTAYVKPRHAEFLIDTAAMTNRVFSRFMSGQCLEAVILGVLIFLALTVFSMPYAGLVGVLTALCAFIPYVGAFISCAIGALLVLLTAPEHILGFLIIYLVVQFIETQLIYPHVVGSSVGLSPMWTLVAVLIGGNLFGIIGMIFFIPLAAVCYTLLGKYTNKVLREKQNADTDA